MAIARVRTKGARHARDCRRERKGVMCPGFRTSGDAAQSTEARVAAFKAALNAAAI